MIEANTDAKWLPLYEALASEVRLEIINLLANQSMNVKQLAASLQLSSAIITMHVKKLEKAGLVTTQMIRKDGGTHKMCTLAHSNITIELPSIEPISTRYHEVLIPIGHYTEFEIYPTCGLSTPERVIGQFDDPRYFYTPERVNAGILWFGHGYLEYKLPNYLLQSQKITAIEITLELGSEAPGYNENWPSDIFFQINGTDIGVWTSPGDYGAERGRFSPSWWGDPVNQYGLLKVIRVDEAGTWVDGQKLSQITINEIVIDRHVWSLLLGVREEADHVGGLTLFGKGFGNYSRDISFKTFYE
ncbi:MAG TPA: ArsR family transcriptional regulator [Candidatus Paenibacillus intestinavium]|nr:ArsR family transcriptional regulator [Candidatus Paenibacillus intestinavium]